MTKPRKREPSPFALRCLIRGEARMTNDEGMTKSEDVCGVLHEVLLEYGSVPPLLLDVTAPQAKRRGDAYALSKLRETIPIDHSSFFIISSFVIGHSSFLR